MKLFKSFTAIALALSLSVSVCAAGIPFERENGFSSGIFSDVSSSDWYYSYVENAYETGLMNGMSDGYFAASESITIRQTIVMAARVHSIYNDNGADFTAEINENWYEPYYDYADAHGINFPDRGDVYDITREEFAYVMSSTLPYSEFECTVALPIFGDEADINYNDEVSLLFMAGIITGYSDGTFAPKGLITRAEAATLVARMTNYDLRSMESVVTESAVVDWESIYWDYISNDMGYKIDTGWGWTTDIGYIGMLDLDFDDVPELIISDMGASGGYSTYIYSIDTSKNVYRANEGYYLSVNSPSEFQLMVDDAGNTSYSISGTGGNLERFYWYLILLGSDTNGKITLNEYTKKVVTGREYGEGIYTYYVSDEEISEDYYNNVNSSYYAKHSISSTALQWFGMYNYSISEGYALAVATQK